MNGDIRQYFTRIAESDNVAMSSSSRENYLVEDNVIERASASGEVASNLHMDNQQNTSEAADIDSITNNSLTAAVPLVNENPLGDGLEYEIIPGNRKGSKLVYLKYEQYIFKPINGDDKYGKRFVCIAPSCPARIIIRPNGSCEVSKRSKPHLVHSNHILKREELIAINRIKDTCSNVDALCGGTGINVSVKTIFDNETIRLDFFKYF